MLFNRILAPHQCSSDSSTEGSARLPGSPRCSVLEPGMGPKFSNSMDVLPVKLYATCALPAPTSSHQPETGHTQSNFSLSSLSGHLTEVMACYGALFQQQ